MMGRSHVLMGVCGVTIASSLNWIPWEEPNVGATITGLVLAGSVWPDIDHRSSHVTRSFGPLTYVLCSLARFVSRRIYLATRLPNDPRTKDPHRTFTHTWPGALTAGGLLALVLVADRMAAAVTLGLLFGVAARAWDRDWQPFAAAGGGLLMWDLWPSIGDSWWVYSLALAAGCWLHVYTDCVTKAGAPMAWPKVTVKKEVIENDDGTVRTRVMQRRRWHMTGPPHWIRFYAGGVVEPWIVRGTVTASLLLSYWIAFS